MTPERTVIENLFRIADKNGVDMDFVLNPIQARLDSEITGRDLVPKARQEGVSSYVLARYTVKCLGQRNTRAVVISHDKESTQRMLAKVRYYLQNFKGPNPIIKNDSKNEITFPKTNSAFYIGTAGARKFGRGDTITHLHCSEVAFWPDPKAITAGLFQAVPSRSGEIIIESTGFGVGNWYHRFCMGAAKHLGRYRLHFLDWQSFPEYCIPLSREEEDRVMDGLLEELEEPRLVSVFGLSAGQIQWRRNKLEEMEYDLQTFKQEYPMTLDECFQSRGRSLFHIVKYEPTKEWRKRDQFMYVLGEHPFKDKTYIMGVDVSAGVGADRSVIEIFDLDTLEQVAEWVSDRTSPDVFAHKIAQVGSDFNEAYTVIESNNHGIATILELRTVYPLHKIFKEIKQTTNAQSQLMTLGHRTSILTKPIFISKLRHLLAKEMVIHSETLMSELSTFVEDENGKLGADEGCYDDTVIASAKATMGIERAIMLRESPIMQESYGPDPFRLDSIIDEMHGRREDFPIRRQAIIEADFERANDK